MSATIPGDAVQPSSQPQGEGINWTTKGWYGLKIVAYLALAGGFGVASFYSYIHGERFAAALCGVVGLIPLSRVCSLAASINMGIESKGERKWWADHLKSVSNTLKPKEEENEDSKKSLKGTTKAWYVAKMFFYFLIAGGLAVGSYYSYMAHERAACALVGLTALIPLARLFSLLSSLTMGTRNESERKWWAKHLEKASLVIGPKEVGPSEEPVSGKHPQPKGND